MFQIVYTANCISTGKRQSYAFDASSEEWNAVIKNIYMHSVIFFSVFTSI